MRDTCSCPENHPDLMLSLIELLKPFAGVRFKTSVFQMDEALSTVIDFTYAQAGIRSGQRRLQCVYRPGFPAQVFECDPQNKSHVAECRAKTI